MPDGMDLMRPTANRLSRSELIVDVETRPHVDNDPAMFDMTVAVPLALPVVVQTRPQVGCDPDLPLPMSKGQGSLMEDGPDDIVSGRESIIERSDVHREICEVSDQGPVVVPKFAAEVASGDQVLPQVVPDVDTCGRSGMASCAPVFTWPVNDEMISQVGVDPDLLSGQVEDDGSRSSEWAVIRSGGRRWLTI